MDLAVSESRKYISELLTYKMSSSGFTISHIKKTHRKQILPDALQIQHKEEPVWHTRAEILEYVAKELKMDSKYWGPKRETSDFYNIVDQEIAKLRKKHIIENWNHKSRTGIFRIASSYHILKKPTMSTNENTNTTQTTETNDLKTVFVSILAKGKKDNTYKFALARALIEYCRDTQYSDSYDIPYTYFAQKFLEYYWHQECKYKIRQSFKTESTPKVIQAIRQIFKDRTYVSFNHVSEKEKQQGIEQILKTVFGHARLKTSLVIPRFQNISKGNSTISQNIFYEYDDNCKILRLKPNAFNFFKRNHSILSMAINFEWSKFLERINGQLPKLVAKIEQDELCRKSLTKYRKIYQEYTSECFYCKNSLEEKHTHVDHFIPWNYIRDDQMWNLVLACNHCNCKKGASLPQEYFQNKLVKRNDEYGNQITTLEHSLNTIDTRWGWKKEIQNQYKICKEYGFGTIKLP